MALLLSFGTGAIIRCSERCFKLLDGSFFYPANWLWIAHLPLQYSPRERRMECPQRPAIQSLFQPLAQLPVNPEPVGTRFGKPFATAYLLTKRTVLLALVPSAFRSSAGNETAPMADGVAFAPEAEVTGGGRRTHSCCRKACLRRCARMAFPDGLANCPS